MIGQSESILAHLDLRVLSPPFVSPFCGPSFWHDIKTISVQDSLPPNYTHPRHKPNAMGPGTNSVDAFIGRLVPTALFLDTYKHLPASASVYHPHVIDTDLYNEELLKDEEVLDVKIQDAVATVLYKISKNILGQFLDDRTTSFKFVQWTEVGGVQGSKLIIWKNESRVLVSGRARNS